MLRNRSWVLAAGLLVMCGAFVQADDPPAGTNIAAAGGKLQLEVPGTWQAGPKRSRILEYEFFAPADSKDPAARARITMMSSGGSIEANIERWIGQFKQPDGKATDDVAKIEKFSVDGQTVHLVDITGNYEESMGGGPFAPGRKVLRKDYQMLGAIIVSKDVGQYFVKMTGPKAVCKELSEGFKAMLKKLEVN